MGPDTVNGMSWQSAPFQERNGFVCACSWRELYGTVWRNTMGVGIHSGPVMSEFLPVGSQLEHVRIYSKGIYEYFKACKPKTANRSQGCLQKCLGQSISCRLVRFYPLLLCFLQSDYNHTSKRPVISLGLQQSILTQLISLFDGVAAHYQLIRDARKKEKEGITASPSHEKTENTVTVSEPVQESHRLSTSTPPIIPHITVGINEVTKALEREIQSMHRTVIAPNTAVDETQSLTKVVFICYANLDTPALVAHLPQLVALCNSARSEHHKIKVVQLPAGAHISLAGSLGYLKRVSVITLDVCPFRLLSWLLTL